MDDSFDDYFEEGSVPQEKKPEVETPEQREERELRESTIERRYDRRRYILLSVAGVLGVLLVWWLGNRYFHVYETGKETGVIMEVVNRGSLFKTYEGKMMSERAYLDTVLYRTDFIFTVRDDSLAAEIYRYAGTGRKVELEYESYRGSLPWRGESNRIVVAMRRCP